MADNYTGISFPFRVSNQGSVVISSINDTEAPHLNESIEQLLHTSFGERVMENEIYSDIESLLFQPNDISLQTLVADNIVEAIEDIDERITIEDDGISFVVDNEYLYVTIEYTTSYSDTQYETTINLGEVGVEDE